MSKQKRLVFIVNPMAKNGLSLKVWRKIEKNLISVDYRLFYTAEAGDGSRLAKQVAEEREEMLIVAVGGDGTIHEVMNGAIDYPHVTFGFIPAGSGNDFARGYDIPASPTECLNRIIELLEDTGELYDAGYYENQHGKKGYFFNSMGAGFDASIAVKASRSPVKKWLNYLGLGQAIYAFYLIAEIFTYQPGTVDVIVDGIKRTYKKTWFVTVSNQPYYGGGMQISPSAHPQDGQLHMIVVHQLSRIKLLFVFLSVFWGKHLKFKEVDSLTMKDVVIQFHTPVPIHVDGENFGFTPLHVKIDPKCWRFIQKVEEFH